MCLWSISNLNSSTNVLNFRFSSRCTSKKSINNNTENKNSKSNVKTAAQRGSHDKVTSLEKEPRTAWGPTSSFVSDE